MHGKNIHALVGVGYHVPDVLLLDQTCIPLRKRGLRIDGICFAVEGGDSIDSKIFTQYKPIGPTARKSVQRRLLNHL